MANETTKPGKTVGTGESMTNIKVSFSINGWGRLVRG